MLAACNKLVLNDCSKLYLQNITVYVTQNIQIVWKCIMNTSCMF